MFKIVEENNEIKYKRTILLVDTVEGLSTAQSDLEGYDGRDLRVQSTNMIRRLCIIMMKTHMRHIYECCYHCWK